MAIVRRDIEERIMDLGLASPKYCSGDEQHVIGWGYSCGGLHGFAIVGGSIYNIVGGDYSFFNAYCRDSDTVYLLAEYYSDSETTVGVFRDGSRCLKAKSLPQCSVIIRIDNGEPAWCASISTKSGSVRAYSIMTKGETVFVSGSVRYGNSPLASSVPHGFVATLLGDKLHEVHTEPGTNLVGLHSSGLLVTVVESTMFTYVGDACVHECPVTVDLCGDHLLMRSPDNTFVYDVRTGRKANLGFSTSAFRSLDETSTLLYSPSDSKWCVFSSNCNPYVFLPRSDMLLFASPKRDILDFREMSDYDERAGNLESPRRRKGVLRVTFRCR